MPKRILLLLSVTFLCIKPAFSESEAARYYTDFGIAAYKTGNYSQALAEFKKALLIEPYNDVAQDYMNRIFERELQTQRSAGVKPQAQPVAQKPVPAAPAIKKSTPKPAPVQPVKRPSRANAMDEAMNKLDSKQETQIYPEQMQTLPFENEERKPGPKIKVGPLAITGDIQMRAGVDGGSNFIWNRANWDLNERNYRQLSRIAFDRGFNTYDPRIYDRLGLNVDTTYDKGFNVHGNVMIDPWSSVGKSDKVSVVGTNGDVVQIQPKFWSNTGYTINQTYQSSEEAEFVNIPEMKVENGRTQGQISVRTNSGNVFNIPEIKINSVFQPTRELWVDYAQDNLKVRAFPIAYENQALSFDDPLKLSNNRIWWEDSPWIRAWKPGTLNRGLNPVDFTKGYYDSSLSAFARDSEGRRLVGLRGASMQFYPAEGTSIEAEAAASRSPWQDYAEVDNAISALRAKQEIGDNLRLGMSTTGRFGFNINDASRFDTWNYVIGGDLSYEVLDGILASAEVAHSMAKYDLSESQFKTDKKGYAYYFSLIGRYPFTSIIDTKYGYEGIDADEHERFFNKFRFFAGRMDKSFDPALSSYIETRDDEWWGRHMHFRKPFKDYYTGEGSMLGWNDVKNFAIGNGMDIGRNVLAMRVESQLWDKRVNNLFDVRTVNSTNYKFVENVAHDELTWRIGSRLTTKFMGLYHVLPKTTAGIDPYIFDPVTRDFVTNDVIEADKDPSVGVGSLGAEYAFFDWLALNGIWEYTNDLSLGLDNYPRRLLNDKNLSSVYGQNGEQYRQELQFLYSQGFFPKPPYPYNNVFKAGLRVNPLENMEIYLDYTRNPFEKAGIIDDNMNHIGLELTYNPMPKLGLFFRYNYSRWQDLDKLIAGDTKLFGHHNFFGEITFHRSADEDFTLQYGEGGRNPFMGGFLALNWDPYGGSLATVDTQHIVRLYYRRKF